MKFSIVTLGCKLNQAESDEIKNELIKLGHIFVPFHTTADIVIIRACAVTMNASQTARELIRQAKKQGSFVIVGGCLENSDLPEIDYIAQTAGDIVKKVALLDYRLRGNDNRAAKSQYPNALVPNRTRALIKIQTGCNFNCAYCIIPFFRGKSKSVPVKNIIKKIIKAEKENFKEITLTGVNICLYRSGKTNLAGLLKKILSHTKIERIRIGSLDPRLIPSDLISIFDNPRLMPHWHLSLQSGSDGVLTRMKRGYTTKNFFSLIKIARAHYPLFSFTTDIITGFPGETEKEFNETFLFVKKVGFTKVHVFPYSKRPNTMAEQLKEQVQDKIKKERVKRLIRLSESIAKKYESKLKGKIRPVLFEQKKDGYWIGFTPEYTRARYRSDKNLKNKIIKIKIGP